MTDKLDLDALNVKLKAAFALVDETTGECQCEMPKNAWGEAVIAVLEAAPALIEAAEERDALKAKLKPKTAPVQGYPPGIPWEMHLRAYDVYCKKYGKQDALIDLEGRNCRGGFSTRELDGFIPGWRDELSEFTALRAKLATAEKALEPFAEYAEKYFFPNDRHGRTGTDSGAFVAKELWEAHDALAAIRQSTQGEPK